MTRACSSLRCQDHTFAYCLEGVPLELFVKPCVVGIDWWGYDWNHGNFTNQGPLAEGQRISFLCKTKSENFMPK